MMLINFTPYDTLYQRDRESLGNWKTDHQILKRKSGGEIHSEVSFRLGRGLEDK